MGAWRAVKTLKVLMVGGGGRKEDAEALLTALASRAPGECAMGPSPLRSCPHPPKQAMATVPQETACGTGNLEGSPALSSPHSLERQGGNPGSGPSSDTGLREGVRWLLGKSVGRRRPTACAVCPWGVFPRLYTEVAGLCVRELGQVPAQEMVAFTSFLFVIWFPHQMAAVWRADLEASAHRHLDPLSGKGRARRGRLGVRPWRRSTLQRQVSGEFTETHPSQG